MEKHALILTTTGDFLEKFELGDARLLQRLGYQVHYAANLKEPSWFSGAERLKKKGIRLHHLEISRSPFQGARNLKALGELLRLIRAYRISLLHCHTPVGGILGRLAGALSREKPVVLYTAHGFHFYRGAPALHWLAYFPAERFLARLTDYLLVINREDMRLACRLPLKKGGQAFWIPGVGLDRKKFSPPSPRERERARKALGIGQEFFLVSAGEINENKNHQVLLKALLGLRKRRGSLRGIRCAICGGGFYLEKLKRWGRAQGLEGIVKPLGHCEDVRPYLAAADLFVFPSRREGLGMAALEALAMGIPVLASDNRGTREYMRDGENGCVCPWNEPGAFAAGICRIQGLDGAARQRMRRACIRSARPFDRRYARAVMAQVYRRADRRAALRRSSWEETGRRAALRRGSRKGTERRAALRRGSWKGTDRRAALRRDSRERAAVRRRREKEGSVWEKSRRFPSS